MRAERLGSYSMAATFAGIPIFSRRKSITRYFCAWPPPRCQEVTSPWALRPPVRFCVSTSDFSGVCLVISLLSSMVKKRRDGVYGLNVFSAIVASNLIPFYLPILLAHRGKQSLAPRSCAELNIFSVFDHLFAFGQSDVRFFPVAAKTLGASPAAKLAVKNRRAHVVHFHLEDALHGFLDFSLG